MAEKTSSEIIRDTAVATLDLMYPEMDGEAQYTREGVVRFIRDKSGTVIITEVHDDTLVLSLEADIENPNDHSMGYIYDVAGNKQTCVDAEKIEAFADYVLRCLKLNV